MPSPGHGRHVAMDGHGTTYLRLCVPGHHRGMSTGRVPNAMDPPPLLELPLDEPVPPPDCGVCAALVRQRSEAKARDDLSRASDCNVEIRNHHPARRKRRR